MKKIVFIEKQQSTTYDPVSTFFANTQQNLTNKKSNSVMKPTIQPQQNKVNSAANKNNTGSVQRPPSTKNIVEQKKVQQKQEKPITGKIGRKGEHLPPKQVGGRREEVGAVKKEENVYGLSGVSKKNIRTQNQGYSKTPEKYSIQIQKQQPFLPNVNQKRSPHKPSTIQQPTYITPNPQKRPQPQPQLHTLQKRIKALQQNQHQLLQKIQQLQLCIQKLQKSEQKLQRLQKQQKQSNIDTKDTLKKLKQKQEQLRSLLQKQDIPFNKKRQFLLTNQIYMLKRINRQLVTRVKNYRGTDLVEVSIANNKTDVLYKEYDHTVMVNQEGVTVDNQGTGIPDLTKLQSLTFRVIQELQRFIDNKMESKTKEGKDGWVEDKKAAMQLASLCKQLSLQSLSMGWKMPQKNSECINMYNQIQRYRHSIQPILSKQDLNFKITQQNIDLINKASQQHSLNLQLIQTSQKQWHQSKKFKKSSEASAYYLHKFLTQSQIYQKQSHINHIILAHCLSQISYIRAQASKAMSSLKQQLSNLNLRLKDMREFVQAGENGKEALFIFVRENVGEFGVKVGELEGPVREIGGMLGGLVVGRGKGKEG